MSTRRILATCAISVGALVATACGTSSGSTAPAATSAAAIAQPASTPTTTALPSPVPPPTGFPTGTYAGNLGSDSGAPGTLTLNADGTYRIKGATSDSIDISGVYTVAGSGITFVETHNATCTTGGSYTWQITGNTLKLTVVKDTCAGGARSVDFSEHPWVKQP